MERDKQLKNLLEKSIATASADFTTTILNRIEQLKPDTISYQPLVSNAIKKIFMIVFSSVVILIFLLCLIIKASELDFVNTIQLPVISVNTYYNVLVFITAFWIVFSVNNLAQKKRLRAY